MSTIIKPHHKKAVMLRARRGQRHSPVRSPLKLLPPELNAGLHYQDFDRGMQGAGRFRPQPLPLRPPPAAAAPRQPPERGAAS